MKMPLLLAAATALLVSTSIASAEDDQCNQCALTCSSGANSPECNACIDACKSGSGGSSGSCSVGEMPRSANAWAFTLAVPVAMIAIRRARRARHARG